MDRRRTRRFRVDEPAGDKDVQASQDVVANRPNGRGVRVLFLKLAVRAGPLGEIGTLLLALAAKLI